MRIGCLGLVPNRNDDLFGVGLLLDGILLPRRCLGGRGAADLVNNPRILLAVTTAVYLGLVVIALIVVRTTDPGRRLSTALLTVGFAVIGLAGVFHLYEHKADHIPDALVTFGWISGRYFFALSG